MIQLLVLVCKRVATSSKAIALEARVGIKINCGTFQKFELSLGVKTVNGKVAMLVHQL